MKIRHTPLVAALSLAAAFASAQTAADTTVQRSQNQQERIERGLQDGSLTVREAGRLERQQGRVNHLQSRALRDGTVSPEERARLDAAQDQASARIAATRHNGRTGDPNSAASLEMQSAVARNARQQQRIENGLASGELTHREAARLEHGQAHVARKEARAAADGQVGEREQARIDRAQDRQSKRIYRQKHDAQDRG